MFGIFFINLGFQETFGSKIVQAFFFL
eukprot:COSAG01_NODE_47785_length_387_cov_0.604167_1_plen_26_part_10